MYVLLMDPCGGNPRHTVGYLCSVVASLDNLNQASRLRARVAQWIERHRPKVGVGGSSPSAGATPVPGSAILDNAPTSRCRLIARVAVRFTTVGVQERLGIPMELHIRTNGTKVTDGMREFIDRRMAKLDRIAEHVIDAHLELRTEESRMGTETTTAQLTLHTGRHVLRSEERDTEPARAVDSAIDKLISQVRKYNDKKVSRRKRSAGRGAFVDDAPILAIDDAAPAAVEDEEGMDHGQVVRTKRFPMKPMLVDEAIDQMQLVGHEFFLFRNVDENELNVLYRRRDGSYGLLAPADG